MECLAEHRRVGETAIARWFYAGRYADVVAATVDRDGELDPIDSAFVVGSLTFLGRLDDARACAAIWHARSGVPEAAIDDRTAVACRFFLGLAAARAGEFDRSHALLVRAAFRSRHASDPWIRALTFQGMACHWYFIGRYTGAARLALHALAAAHDARFLYATLLSTDLRGHALVQLGQLQRGIALLEQAKQQARHLGLHFNAYAVESSIATYRTRFRPYADALDRVEQLLRRRAHDSYSRRALLTEAAIQRALRGRRTEALEALEAADRDALRGDTRRGKMVSVLARLWVTRWRHGLAACRELVDHAREIVDPRDVAFRAELLGFDALIARAIGDIAREAHALGELRAIWHATHHFSARAALGQLDAALAPTKVFDEDELAPLLGAVARRDPSALPRLLELGLLAAVPELLGLAPARRIIVIPSQRVVLLEDHGDVIARDKPPRWCQPLLRLLASGQGSKREIVASLWGLRAYHPELHDPPVRTMIHRLRAFLKPCGEWIEVGDDGYRTAVPVHLVGAPEPSPAGWAELDVVREPAIPPPEVPDTSMRVRQCLRELEVATVPELSRALQLSQSTVLRAVRELVDERRIERIGYARATRYRAI